MVFIDCGNNYAYSNPPYEKKIGYWIFRRFYGSLAKILQGQVTKTI